MALTKVPSNLDATVATTQSASDNSTNVATTAYVTTALSNLVDSSPSALNTLNELAAALNDDASFSTTVNNSIATKLPLAGGTMSGALNMGSQNITNAGTISSGNIGVGASDSANGTITIHGGASGNTEGGEIRLQTSADYDGTYDFYRLDVINDDFRIGRQGQTDFYVFQDGLVKAENNFEVGGAITSSGTISSGVINAFGASGGSNLAYASNFKANGANVQITFERGNDSTGWGGIGANNANALMVYNGSTQEKLSLTQAGNLTVAGTMASGAITSTGDFLINESANTERSVRIQNSTVTSLFGVEGSSANRFVGSAANNMFLGTTTADGIEFATNNNVRATIDSSGDAVFQGSVTIQDGSADFTMSGDSSNNTYLISNGEFRIRPSGTTTNKFVIGSNGNLTTAGHLYTSGSAASDIGAAANYWRDAFIQDVYTQDLHLSNENREKGGNDIDGTKGDWTIQEGEENLYIINNKTGKKFKFALEEVS